MLWCLNDSDILFSKQRERTREECRCRDEIGVKDGDEIRRSVEPTNVPQRVVNVPRFRVRVVRPAQIVALQLCREFGKPCAPSGRPESFSSLSRGSPGRRC